jgi:autotransporter-associated beta strand protein
MFGDNSYNGLTTVEEGTLVAAHDNALGLNASTVDVGEGTIVSPGGSLGIQEHTMPAPALGPVTITENILTNGSGAANRDASVINISGDNTLSSNVSNSVDLNPSSIVSVGSEAGTLTVEGDIDGGGFGAVTFGGAGDVVVNGIVSGDGGVPYDIGLNHFGYHINNDNATLDLNNNGGMMGGGDPTTYSNFQGQALLTDGPGGRGLDYNNDGDFRSQGAINRNDNYSNLFVGVVNVSAANAGVWTFDFVSDDDRVGFWIDLNQNGSFESTTAGLGDNRGEQVTWDDGTARTVTLAEGAYTVAFTHREGGGGSQINMAVSAPTLALQTIKPTGPDQQGIWSPAFGAGLQIDPTPSLQKYGIGSVTLNSANTFEGPTEIHGGTLIAANTDALGTTTGATISDGGALGLSGGITLNNVPISVDGTGPATQPGAIVNITGDNSISASSPITAAEVSLGEFGIGSNDGTLTVDAAVEMSFSKLSFDGAGNVVVNTDLSGIGQTEPRTFPLFDGLASGENELYHYGFHINNDNLAMNLDNNGGMLGGGDPRDSAGLNYQGVGVLTNGPGSRGLDFNNDADFRAVPVIDGAGPNVVNQNDNYSNLWFGYLHVDAANAGTWQIRNAGDDDRAGHWLDLDQDGVFESSTPGLGQNRGEQLSWENGGQKSVALTEGDYLVAFTHREGGGGSRADFRFTSPGSGERIVKPGDAGQAGIWNTERTFIYDSNNEVMKMGTGSVTLSATNNYNGNTTIMGGTLDVDGAIGGSAASTSVSVLNGGTLSGEGLVADPVSGSLGSVVHADGPGTLTIGDGTGSGYQTSGKTMVDTGAILQVNDSDAVELGQFTLVDGTMNVTSNEVEVAGGNLSGSGTLNANVSNFTVGLSVNGTSDNTGDNIQVNTDGTLVAAVNFAPNTISDATNNGVTFVASDSASGSAGGLNYTLSGVGTFGTADNSTMESFSNGIAHYGYHINNDNLALNLHNNAGMVNGGDPTSFTSFFGESVVTDGPGNRGLDFNNDGDFNATGAIGQNDQFSNLFLTTLVVPNGMAGTWNFRINMHDDPSGIWLDLDQDGVFESGNGGLGDANGELIAWNGGCCAQRDLKSVTLAEGEYQMAFTHREGGGGSQIDITFAAPGISERTIKPTDPAQAGLWNVLSGANAADDLFFSDAGFDSQVDTLTLSVDGLDASKSYVVEVLHGDARVTADGDGVYNIAMNSATNGGTGAVNGLSFGTGDDGDAAVDAEAKTSVSFVVNGDTGFNYDVTQVSSDRPASIAGFQVRELGPAVGNVSPGSDIGGDMLGSGVDDPDEVGTLSTLNVTFAPTNVSVFDVDMTTAATDQLNVTGTVSLGGATLDLVIHSAPPLGDHVIIANDAADAVSGEFDTLTDDLVFDHTSVGGDDYVLQIDYQGDDGNDVVLENFGIAETLITLDAAGNLVITDIHGGNSDDDLTIAVVGTDLVISDSALAITTGGTEVADLIRLDGRTVQVDASSVTNITLDALLGTDVFTIQDALTIGGDLTVNDTETTNINGGAVTAANQTYNGPVVLGADTTLTSANVSLNSTVDGAQTLTVDGSGVTTFGGIVGGTTALTSLTTDVAGSLSLNAGAVTTTGAQTFNDAATLGAATTLTSTGSGDVTLAAVDGAQTLAVDTAGGTILGGVVGGTTPLTSVTTDAPGSVTFSGGSVETSGAQTYNDAATLGANTTLTGDSVAFNGTVAGATNDLTIDATTTTLGDDAADAITGVGALTTNAAGTTTINTATVSGDVVTFNDPVVLGESAAVTGTTSVTFNGTVAGAGNDLTVNSPATTFGDAVADTVTGVANLTTDAAGTTTINTDTVTTTGNQTFNDAVVLGTAVTLTSSGSGTISLLLTVDGAQTLAINTDGLTIIDATVGGTTPLTSLTTDANGTTQLGGDVTTTDAQTINDAVTLTADSALTSTNGPVAFAATIDGAFDLTIANPNGSTTFGGAIGATPLTTLDVTSGGPFAITAGSTTSGDTTLLVGGTVTLSGAAVTAGGALDITGATTIAISSPLSTVNQGSITGSVGADDISLDSNALTGNFSVDGLGGNDTLTLNDQTDATDDTNVVVTTTQATGLIDSGSVLDFVAVETLTINAGSGNDTYNLDAATGGGVTTIEVFGGLGDDKFTMTTNQDTDITVHGGSPVAPASPGDTLDLKLFNADGVIVFPATTDGSFSSSGGLGANRDVVWTSIETFFFDGQEFIAGDLFVQGVQDSDRMIFSNGGGNRVLTRINNIFYGAIPVTGKLVAWGMESADRITVSGNLAIDVEIHGDGGVDDAGDYIATGTGNDTVYGGDGNDTILVGEGDNTAFGGAGNDGISGRRGRDTLIGGEGNDRLNGSSGDDVLIGDEENGGGFGNDNLVGGSGNDVLFGGPSNDILNGQSGNDVLIGYTGNDFIRGDRGNDLLIGGDGIDSVHGDSGNDLLYDGIAANSGALTAVALDQILIDWNANLGTAPAGLGALTSDGMKDLMSGGGSLDDIFLGAEDLTASSGGDNLMVI